MLCGTGARGKERERRSQRRGKGHEGLREGAGLFCNALKGDGCAWSELKKANGEEKWLHVVSGDTNKMVQGLASRATLSSLLRLSCATPRQEGLGWLPNSRSSSYRLPAKCTPVVCD